MTRVVLVPPPPASPPVQRVVPRARAMFDIATRPYSSVSQAATLAVPFDWRLVTPAPVADYPYTDYSYPDGVPQAAVERLATYALELEDGLQTAIIISLFTDARADRDAVLPLRQTDRRGWVGDEFMPDSQGTRADLWGSALWLVYISKVTPDVLERARFAALESLDWLVRDGIASRVEVTAQWAGPRNDQLALRVGIYKPDQIAPVYDVLWGTSLRRWKEQSAPHDAVCIAAPASPAAPVVRKLAWSVAPGQVGGPFAPENAGVVSGNLYDNTDHRLYFRVVGGFANGVSVDFVGPGNDQWRFSYDAQSNIGRVDLRSLMNPFEFTPGLLEIHLFLNGVDAGSISCAVVGGNLYPNGSFASFSPN
jgi:phage gp46-like protein